METCDKNRRPLRVGDVLKVFHYIGARRKKYYMYKQVVGEILIGGHGGAAKVAYYDVSHLNMSDKENYVIGKADGVLTRYEIVQGLDDIESRPKLAT